MNAYAYLSLVPVIVNLMTGVYVLWRGPKLLLNRLVFAVLLSLAVWATGEFIMRSATTTQTALRGSKVAGLGWCLVGAVFVVFVLAFTEKEKYLTNPFTYVALFVPGIFFLVVLWTTDLVFKGFTKSYWGYREVGGPVRLASQLYVALMFIIGIVLLFEYWRTSQSRRKRTNTGFVLIASLIPICAGLLTDIILPLAGIHVVELSMFASTVIGPLIGYAVINHGLLTPMSGSLGSAIITRIQDAVFVTDSEGLIETANQVAELLTGYSEAELLETPIDRLFTGAPALDKSIPGRIVEDQPLAYCIDKQGELIPVMKNTEVVRRNIGSPIGSVIVLQDMRETLRLTEAEEVAEAATAEAEAERDRSKTLRHVKEELRELSEFLESVIDNMTEPLWIQDRDHHVVLVNRAFCELSGFSKVGTVGRNANEIIAAEDATSFRKNDAFVFETGGPLETDETILDTTKNMLRTLRTIRTPLRNEAGDVEHIVCIFSDITEQKRLDDARLEFIRVAAHELRTPLTSLKLGFDVLARETRGSLNEDQQRSLDVLSLSIERLSALAKNLLDLASLDAGLLALNPQPVDLGQLVGEAAGLFSSTIREKGLYCDVRFDGDLRPAYADPSRLSQVLYNLVSNAVKYTDDGGITIAAKDSADDFLEICVADTGVGISPARLDSIFTSFVKVAETEAAREGTGLGLSITKAIVEAHGGRIWVESHVGEGSKFYFTVKAANDQAASTPAP